MNEFKKYIINELCISPKSLKCKGSKIIKSDYIIAALCLEEIFVPDYNEMVRLIEGVVCKDESCIIKLLSIDLCVESSGIESEFIKAFIGEHFC